MNLEQIKQLESQANSGRGVSCVRGMISSVEHGDIAGAMTWYITDHDKLRQYPQLKQALGNYLLSLDGGQASDAEMIAWMLEEHQGGA